jgi:ferredoxin
LATDPEQEGYTVYGTVSEVHQVPSYTYVILTDGSQDLWVAMGKMDDVSVGTELIVRGGPTFNFPSASLGRTFDLILFGGVVQSEAGVRKSLVKSTDQIKVAVYKGEKRIVQGTAEYWSYRGTRVGRVMIKRGIMGDINIIYSARDGDEAAVTIKFVPLINELWFGIILFAAGITAILFSPKTGFAGLDAVVVSKGLCTGCGTCAEVCPEEALEVDETPQLIGECVDCSYCLDNCPERP